jgi:hypothetical protein
MCYNGVTMAKYRIVKTSTRMTDLYGRKLSWYKLEEKSFLTGWLTVSSGYFETDCEAEQSLKPDRIISEFEK